MRNLTLAFLAALIPTVFLTRPAFAGAGDLVLSTLPKIVTQRLAAVGPAGEMVSYGRDGDKIVLRQCAIASKHEADLKEGCSLKEGTSEVRLSETDFRGLVQAQLILLGQDPKSLSPQAKAFLGKILASAPAADQYGKELQALKERQEGLADFRTITGYGRRLISRPEPDASNSRARSSPRRGRSPTWSLSCSTACAATSSVSTS